MSVLWGYLIEEDQLIRGVVHVYRTAGELNFEQVAPGRRWIRARSRRQGAQVHIEIGRGSRRAVASRMTVLSDSTTQEHT